MNRNFWYNNKVNDFTSFKKEGLSLAFVPPLFIFSYIHSHHFSVCPLEYKDSLGLCDISISLFLCDTGNSIHSFWLQLPGFII